jgi:hypothetical protein
MALKRDLISNSQRTHDQRRFRHRKPPHRRVWTHILFLDGVFAESDKIFSAVEKLQDQQVEVVLAAIAEKIIKLCWKRGFISDDPDQVQVGKMDSLFDEGSAISAALSASIKGKIAFGPRAGQNVRFHSRRIACKISRQ